MKIIILTALTVIVIGYMLSVLFFYVRRMHTIRRAFLFAFIAICMLSLPVIIPAQFPVIRWLAATTLMFFVMKSWEVHLHPGKYKDVLLGEYIPFLMNHCLMVPADEDDFRIIDPVGHRLRNFLLRSTYMILSTALLVVLFKCNWRGQSLWLEHTLKATVSLIWLINAFNFYGAGWRLAGFNNVLYAGNLISTYTPAVFWRRWNGGTQQWFYEDVFKPLAGTQYPIRGLLLTFALSGAMHEYIVDISLGRMTGYMLVFFMIQGFASVITWKIRLYGLAGLIGTVFTYAFLVFSAIFFFIPINEAVPFYSSQIPSWLQLW